MDVIQQCVWAVGLPCIKKKTLLLCAVASSCTCDIEVIFFNAGLGLGNSLMCAKKKCMPFNSEHRDHMFCVMKIGDDMG